MVFNLGGIAISATELRTDGLWLLFDQGEEAGPFRALDDALEFLAYVDRLQQAASCPAAPDHANRTKGTHSTRDN